MKEDKPTTINEIIVSGEKKKYKKENVRPLDLAKAKFLEGIIDWIKNKIHLTLTNEPEFTVIHTFDIPGSAEFFVNVGLKIKVFVYTRALGFSIRFI